MEQARPGVTRGGLTAVVSSPRYETPPEPAPVKTCVVVLGMHRSGTSAVAGALGLLGVTLPNDLMGPFPGNQKGHFESTGVTALDEKMLAALHTTWYDLRQISSAALRSDIAQKFQTELVAYLEDRYGDASLFVLKDPRACRFLPLWRSAISAFGAAPHLVFCVRNPIEVGNSLIARDQLAFAHGVGLWLRHVLDLEFHSRDMPRVFNDFSDFVQDWRSSVAKIEQQLGILLPCRWTDAEASVDTFVNTELRHEIAGRSALGARFGPEAWPSHCYEAFAALAQDPYDREAMQQLDGIRDAFQEPSRFFGVALTEYYTELFDLRRDFASQASQLSEVAAGRAAAQAETERLGGEHAGLKSQLEGLNAQYAAASASLQQLEAQRNALQQQNAELAGTLQAAQKASADLAKDVENARSEHATTSSALAELEADRNSVRQQNAELKQSLEAAQAAQAAALTELEADRDAVRQQNADLSQRLEAMDQAQAAVTGEFTSQLERLRSEHASSLDMLQALEAERTTLQQQNETLTQSLESLRTALSQSLQLEQECAELRSALLAANADHEASRHELNAQLAEVQATASRLSRAQVLHARIQADLERELDALRAENSTRQAEHEQLLRKFAETTQIAAQRQVLVDQTEATLSEVRQKQVRLQETLSEEVAQMDRLRAILMSQLNELEAERTTLQQQNETLTQSLESLRTASSQSLQLEQECAELRSALLAANADHEASRHELNAQLAEVQATASRLSRAQVLHARIQADLERELDALRAENSTRQAEHEQLLRKFAETTQIAAQRQVLVDQTEATLSEVRQKQVRLQETLSEEVAQMDRLRAILMSQLNELETTRSELEAAKLSIDEIYRSRSWRITAPLRRVRGLIGR